MASAAPWRTPSCHAGEHLQAVGHDLSLPVSDGILSTHLRVGNYAAWSTFAGLAGSAVARHSSPSRSRKGWAGRLTAGHNRLVAETFAWITFAVGQVLVLASASVLLTRPKRRPYLWLVLIGMGTLLLAINVAWYASGGLRGPAASMMRGGMLGFWLSTVTFAEVVALGILAGVRRDEL